MALNSLVIPPGQTPGQIMQATPTPPGASFSQTLLPTLPPGMEDGGGPQLFPNQIDQLPNQYTSPGVSPGGGIRSIMPVRPGPIFNRLPMPNPYRPEEPILGQQLLPKVPDYSSQFDNFGKTLGGFGEQLTGFGDQMTGYQDALGSFNEQVGGMGKQFETLNNRLDSMDKGLGSLGNQIASLENMQQAQPQQVMQPQQQSYNPFGFGGFGGFGGLGSLFGRRY
tara:strand:- start:13 stop:681 length:669 start_codon:yes stop_codon:yes gene_type:complete